MELGIADIPTWTASIAAVLALSFAWISSHSARRMYKLESDREKTSIREREFQEASQRRSQAELVSCWWQDSPKSGKPGVFIQNKSGAPVYHVHALVFSHDGQSELLKFQAGVLPPKAEADHFIIESLPCDEMGEGDFFRVRLTFTDATGIRWERNQYGQLSQLGDELLVQTDFPRAAALDVFREDFINTYGVTIDFEEDVGPDARVKFIQESLSSGRVPDAIIAPHDWIGSFTEHRALETITLSKHHQSIFPKWTLEALTYNDTLCGLPATLDAVALIRNTEMSPRKPETFEEMVSMGLSLQRSGKVDEVFCLRVGEQGDPFQLWPIFSSAGGKVLEKTLADPWDRSQVLLDSDGSINALAKIRSMGEHGSGLLRRSMDAAQALSAFNQRRSAFLIGTSDGLREARLAGVPCAVSPVPPLAEGQEAVSLTLVHGLIMARRGKNKLIGHDLFAEFLTQASVMETLSSAVVAPAARNGINKDDADLHVYQDLCERGLLMPRFSKVHVMWSVLGRAQAAVISGLEADRVARDAAAELRACFRAPP